MSLASRTLSGFQRVGAEIKSVRTQLPGKQDADSDLTAIAGLTPGEGDFIQRKSGVWVNRTPAQVRADLAIPYDLWLKPFGDNTIRYVGYGEILVGFRVTRPFRISNIYYRCRTADGSGNTSVILLKNNSSLTGSHAVMPAASQVAGASVSGTWDYAVGDVLHGYVYEVGSSSPGYGMDIALTATAL